MNAAPSLHELALPALREDNPRDFLAALGLLRMIDNHWPESLPTLYWPTVLGCAKMKFQESLPDDWGNQMLAVLGQWQSSESNPFGHGKIESIEPAELRTILAIFQDESPLFTRYYASLSSQIKHEKQGRRSEFIIESASRSVLNGINDLLLDTKKPIDIAADFLGTSSLREVSNTSRWHPAEYKSAAYSASDPQSMKHRDRPSLNIFALLGLSFYPVIDTSKGRKTPGIRRAPGITEFSRPTWEEPLSVDEIFSLLHHPAVHDQETDPTLLKGLGVAQIWRSRKFCPDGKNDYFSTARPGF